LNLEYPELSLRIVLPAASDLIFTSDEFDTEMPSFKIYFSTLAGSNNIAEAFQVKKKHCTHFKLFEFRKY
jgi:hypothetical protein